MYVELFAELYGTKLIVECCGDGTGFAIGGYYIFMSGVKVVNLTYRRCYSRGAACSGFLHFRKFIDGDMAFLHLYAHVACELHKAAVGH